MPGWVAVANEAAALASTPLERGAILHLYTYADQLRWREFKAADRWLAAHWGMSVRKCRDFLDDLVQLGCVVIEHPGDRHNPRRIRVLRPERKVKHTTEHRVEHQNHGSTGHRQGSESPTESRVEAHGGASDPPSPPDPTPITTTDAHAREPAFDEEIRIWSELADGYPDADLLVRRYQSEVIHDFLQIDRLGQLRELQGRGGLIGDDPIQAVRKWFENEVRWKHQHDRGHNGPPKGQWGSTPQIFVTAQQPEVDEEAQWAAVEEFGRAAASAK